ncbi:hypothetical protein O9929_13595 [Vibrio lentus]|nr:hypothetical protein [Vibrio lentus]
MTGLGPSLAPNHAGTDVDSESWQGRDKHWSRGEEGYRYSFYRLLPESNSAEAAARYRVTQCQLAFTVDDKLRLAKIRDVSMARPSFKRRPT